MPPPAPSTALLDLDNMLHTTTRIQPTSFADASTSSSSSSSSSSEDPTPVSEQPSRIIKPTKPKHERGLNSFGSSWGFTGIGLGFDDTWKKKSSYGSDTDEQSESEVGAESDESERERDERQHRQDGVNDDNDDDNNGDSGDYENGGLRRKPKPISATEAAAIDAVRRSELNSHLSSRTSFRGFGAYFGSSEPRSPSEELLSRDGSPSRGGGSPVLDSMNAIEHPIERHSVGTEPPTSQQPPLHASSSSFHSLAADHRSGHSTPLSESFRPRRLSASSSGTSSPVVRPPSPSTESPPRASSHSHSPTSYFNQHHHHIAHPVARPPVSLSSLALSFSPIHTPSPPPHSTLPPASSTAFTISPLALESAIADEDTMPARSRNPKGYSHMSKSAPSSRPHSPIPSDDEGDPTSNNTPEKHQGPRNPHSGLSLHTAFSNVNPSSSRFAYGHAPGSQSPSSSTSAHFPSHHYYSAVSPSSRPHPPARSASAITFSAFAAPGMSSRPRSSRTRNSSRNRISLVAGRVVPLPFGSTTDAEHYSANALHERRDASSEPRKVDVEADDDFDRPLSFKGTSYRGDGERVGRTLRDGKPPLQVEEASAPASQEPLTNPEGSPTSPSRATLPVIRPLLHPPSAPLSRLPSATEIPDPRRLSVHEHRPSKLGSSIEPGTPDVTDDSNLSRPTSALDIRSPSTAATESTLGRSRSTHKGHTKSSSSSKVKSLSGSAVGITNPRTIDDFFIVGEAGRGAYGLVKRVKEKFKDGSLGPPLIMKQVIKTRILADCWKKHSVYGTIPIEIHIMAALSESEYVLPEPRPWDPMRYDKWAVESEEAQHLAVPSMSSPVHDPSASPASSRASTLETTSSASTQESSVSSAPPASSSEDVTSGSLSDKTLSPPSVPTPSINLPSASSENTSSLQLHTSNELSGDPERWRWRTGAIHHGHPSIIPLLEFFEDAHYYYLILPAAVPSFPPSPPFPQVQLPPAHPNSAAYAGAGGRGSPNLNGNGNGGAVTKFPSDMFDLVERFPYGLPAPLIRSYLGQIADGLSFLHERGICHRDIKDENLVLAEDGRCWLIDFGSSGVVRKEGWDTFSGTLDYAGPEILRGESYRGPPQDVWAFGIVSYVLVVGECPFSSAAEAAIGLTVGSKSLNALEERCGRADLIPSNLPVDQPAVAAAAIATAAAVPLAVDMPYSLFDPAPDPLSPSFTVPQLDFGDMFGAPLPTSAPNADATSSPPPRVHGDPVAELAKATEGQEPDGGGRLGDAMALIKACLQLDIAKRPTFDEILKCRYLSGAEGWSDLAEIRDPVPVDSAIKT